MLRLWPEPHAGQVVRSWQVTVNGAAVEPGPRTGHGDRAALWSAPVPAGDVVVVATGVVEAEDRSGLVTGLTVRPNPAIFLRATDLTRADRAVRDLAPAGPSADDAIAWLHALMASVRARVAYVAGVTTAATSAIDVLRGGQGVCQDHAHLFIAAARAHGVPARYVCGYLFAGTGTGAGALHETHAWAEAWVDGLGWIAFDASAGVCTTERYIRLSTGLDAYDAAPIRGHAVGGSAGPLSVDVRIAPDSSSATGGRVGQARAGQGRAGQGRAGQGRQQQQ